MGADPSLFLPPGLDLWPALGLIGLSFFTSAITAAFSLGGGMLLLSVMVMILPVSALVPVHGLVQFGSNAGRVAVQRRHINWTNAVWMCLGAVPGAIAGGRFVSLLPESAFALAIGAFILVTTWVKLPRQDTHNRLILTVAGAAIGAVGMLIGATGPLTALFLSRSPDRRIVVATSATVMTVQHLSKIAVYIALGFVIGPWLPFVVAMIVAGFFGTFAGSHLLERLPEPAFRLGLKLVLSLAALDLLRRGLGA